MVQQPVSVLPHLRPFVPHIFRQSSQNLAVKISIDSLTRWNKLLMHNSPKIKKMISIELILLQTWRAFFGRGENGVFHWEDRCFVSGSLLYSHDSSPVMTLDRKLGLFLTAFYNSVHTWTLWSRWSLFKRRGTNFSAIRLMFSSSARMRWHGTYYSPTWLQTSWIVCRLSSKITSRTFAIISGVVHVDGQPEYLRYSTDSRPSLKRLNHSDVLAWLKPCSPKASFSIRWVWAAVSLSLKQNLMQILCSLTSAISILADTHENGVKKIAKTRKHVHL